MNILNIVGGATLCASTLAGFSQSSVRCGQPLDAPLQRGAELTIVSLSTEIEVVGTDHDAIHVSCRADDPNTADDVRIQFSGTADHARLTFTGSRFNHNNLHLRVEVPRKLDLALRMPAGDVKVEEIEGNPGYYTSRFYLRPHYQLEGLTVSLRLVSKMPSGK